MKKILCILLFFLYSSSVHAQLKEFTHAYDVDLQENIPYLWRVHEDFKKDTSLYDRKYDFRWRIPTVFNSDFRQKIKTFGSVEKRFTNPDEEEIFRDLQRMPKAFYPYIGPMLHEMKGLSGKILELPGIKETKHKFPDKIASKLQDIPDIEFVSPDLYLFLSPQFWGEDLNTLEFPKELQDTGENPRIRINPEFIRKVREKVKVSDFYPGAKPKAPSLGMRNYIADKDSPLSGADVQAFINTFDGLDKFSKNKDNELKLIMVDSLISYWEEKNGGDKSIYVLKSVVNPCQTIVRKVKWSGLRSEFQEAIGGEAFGLDDWAYTCDKVMKAYRVISMKQAHIAIINALRRGYPYTQLDKFNFTHEERLRQRYFLEATLHLYDSKPADVDAVRPFYKQITDKLLEWDYIYVGSPFIMP